MLRRHLFCRCCRTRCVLGSRRISHQKRSFRRPQKAKQEMIDKFGTPDNAAVTAKKHDTWVAIGQNSGRAWYICSPQGEKVQVSGMPKWAQENAEKFDKEPTERNCQAIAKAFYRLKRSYLGSSRYPNYLFMPKSYCGWYLEGWEDEFGLHSTYGPPLRGDLLDAYEAIRQSYIKRMRAASRKNAYEKKPCQQTRSILPDQGRNRTWSTRCD